MTEPSNKISRGEQIREILRDEAAAMSADAPIAPELSLAERFGVSRTTVRLAIGDLVKEGLLYRIQGSGTFKRAVAVNHITSHVEGFSQQLIRSGFQPVLRDVSVTSVPVPPALTGKLGVKAGSSVWKYSRTWVSGQLPISYGEAYLSKECLPRFAPEEVGLSLLQALEQSYGIPIVSSESFSSAVLPDEFLADKLGIPGNTPLLRMEYYGYMADKRAVFADITHAIGDKYILHIRQSL